MSSVRLGKDLEQQVREAARLAGVPMSQVIRDGVRGECERILARRLDLVLGDVIGSVRGQPRTRRRDTGEEFTELVVQKHAQRRRRRKPA